MLLCFFDLDRAEVNGFLVGRPGDSSVDQGDYANNDENDSKDLHRSSRSLKKMQAAAKGCSVNRRGKPRSEREPIHFAGLSGGGFGDICFLRQVIDSMEEA